MSVRGSCRETGSGVSPKHPPRQLPGRRAVIHSEEAVDDHRLDPDGRQSRLLPGRRASSLATALLTSGLFAWWHAADILHPIATTPFLFGHFAFGLALALLRWRFASIGIGIVAHAAYNSGGTVCWLLERLTE